MNNDPPRKTNCTETRNLRLKIKAQLVEIDVNLSGMAVSEIERHAKALTSLLKLTQALDECEVVQAQGDAIENENSYTPYDQIRPPNDEEMRAVQDRLNRLYNKLRAAGDPELGIGGVEGD